MADDTSTTATSDAPTAPSATDSTVTVEVPDVKVKDDKPADLGDAGKQAIDRMKAERDAARKEAKANADAAKKLADIENAQKTEQERASDALQQALGRVNEAEAKTAAAELRALRLEVAFEKGLTPAQAKRLVGESREDFEADADDILTNFPVKSDGRPKGDADQGVRVVAAAPVAPGLDRVRQAYGKPSRA